MDFAQNIKFRALAPDASVCNSPPTVSAATISKTASAEFARASS